MRVGFIGIGLMGLPLCRRLLAAGVDLAVWNRTAARCAPLQAAGARVAASPAALAASVDVVLLCVADAAAVSAVVEGPDGLLAAARDDLLVADHSSIAPDVTRALAARLAGAGTRWIDAPVSGGVGGAERGDLVIMAGGDPDAIDRLRPLFAHYSQRVSRMGDVGAGQVTKVCNQLIVAANSLLIAETVALATRSGVDASLLAPALAGGFADSRPFQILAPRMAAHGFTPVQWKVDTLLKDLGNALVLAGQSGSPVPMARLAEDLMRLHAGHGHGADDLSSVILLHDPAPAAAPGDR